MNTLHFAVVVGINHYPALGDLVAAHADAKDFYDWVIDPDGGAVPRDNAHLVLASIPAAATVEEATPTIDTIYAAFAACMRAVKAVSAADWDRTRLYFYCAGHGIAPRSRDAALLAANVTQDTMGHHVSAESLLTFFSRVQFFRELVLFSDCCRNRTGRHVDPRPPHWTHADRSNGAVSKYMACAAVSGEQAFEEQELPPDERRGHFTRALLAGLRGHPEAVDPKSRKVHQRSLSDFIATRMAQATPSSHRALLQPDFLHEGPTSIEFGREYPPGALLYPAAVQVQDVNATEVQILDFAGEVVSTWTRGTANEPFSGELPAGLYEAVTVGTSESQFFRVKGEARDGT